VGILAVVDPETGRQRYVQTASKTLRKRYAAAAAERNRDIARSVAAAGAEYLHVSTQDDWLTETLAFATRRTRLRPSRPADGAGNHLSAQHFTPVGNNK
jgi:uncharacterized protein (DUF58 family)